MIEDEIENNKIADRWIATGTIVFVWLIGIFVLSMIYNKWYHIVVGLIIIGVCSYEVYRDLKKKDYTIKEQNSGLDKMIENGKFKDALETITKRVRLLNGWKVLDKEYIDDCIRKQKRETTVLVYIIIGLHIVGGIGALFGWPFIWEIIVRFWAGSARIADGVLNTPIFFFGIPIVFPFTGTIGLLFGSWLLAIGWLFVPKLRIKLDEVTGIKYLRDDGGRIIGKFYQDAIMATGSRNIDNELILNISFPGEGLNGEDDRLRSIWRSLRSWWPFYLDVEQVHIDKYVVITPYKEQDLKEDLELKDEIIDTDLFFVSGPMIYKIFLSGWVST